MLGAIFSFIIDLVFGGIAGYIAGRIMHSDGSTLRNVILGVVGGFVGSVLFSLIGFSASNIIGGMIVSVVGACVCIWLARKLVK